MKVQEVGQGLTTQQVMRVATSDKVDDDQKISRPLLDARTERSGFASTDFAFCFLKIITTTFD